MRKWMLNLHLYGGLLCAPYLIVFGFSSLQFNHHFRFVERRADPVKWDSPLNIEPLTNNDAMAEAVRDSIGLMGWPLPWQTKRNEAGDLQFAMERPGRSYTIRTDLKEHQAHIESRSKGFWQVVTSLHAMGSVPNSRFTSWWGWYTELCTLFVLFAAGSGIYLWVNSKRERKIGMISLAAGVLVSIGLMIYVIVVG